MRFGFSRWLIAALVVANIAVYYWYHLRPEPPPRQLSQRGERLLLLSEVDVEESAPALLQNDGEVAGDAVTSAQTVGVTDTGVLPGDPAEPVSLGPFGTAMYKPTGGELEPIRLTSLRLEVPVEPPVCWRIGPVPAGEERAKLAADLLARDVVIRVQSEVVLVETRYWVYLDVGDDSERREVLRQQLRDRNLDNYLIASGALEGQLSMGLFRTLDRAQLIQRERIAQGFDAQVYLSEATEEVDWYLLDGGDLEKLGWEASPGPVPERPDLELAERPCQPSP